VPNDNLALAYAAFGQQEKALANSLQAMQIDSKDGYAYQNSAGLYIALGRYEESRAILDQAAAQKSESLSTKLIGYQLAFIRGDQAAMKRIFDSVKGSGDEPFLLGLVVNAKYFQGRMREGRELSDTAVQKSEQQSREYAAGIRAAQGAIEMELGNPGEARRQTQSALAMTNDKDIRGQAALTLARLGDSSHAEKQIADLAIQYPDDAILNKAELAVARAGFELQRKKPTSAIEVLEAVRPFEMGSGPSAPVDFWPLYLRGEAYFDLHDYGKALAEYQKIADHRGLNPVSPLYVLARLGAGRAYALQGDAAKAKAAYQDFFAFWKDADSDIPILKQAKTEYERLQ
jgi:eukaryotic-like serine/threonine-protein kinase